MSKAELRLIALLPTLLLAAVFPALGVTVDSSSGWDPAYPASNTVDGVFGTSNCGKANAGGWVVYDFGAPVLISKIRVCAPTLSGSGSQTVNPAISAFGFSNDKSSWNTITTFVAPQLESTDRTDMSEIALVQAVSCRFVRWNITSGGQIGEVFFITSPQIATYEMAQDTVSTNGNASWRTVDGDPATYGEGIGTEGVVTYDQGSSRKVYGFTMQGRHNAGSVNPTSGELWVSDYATSNYQLVGSWTLPALSAGQTGTVDLGVTTGKSGRYIQLRNISGGNQWAEFAPLSHLAHQGQPTTAIIIPDSTFSAVQFAANELQYHIKKATGATVPIYTEANKPSGYQGLIYLGACQATAKAGITTSSLGSNGFVSKKLGADIFILGDDTEGEVLSMNMVRVGTLFGVYDLLESRMGVRWLWPGDSGEVIPQTTSVATPEMNKTHTPQLIHARARNGQWAGYAAWSTTQARDKYQTDEHKWLRRHRFARGVSLEYGHSFEEWWSRFGTSHPEYFNLLPDGTRRSDPLYVGGHPTLISMCVSQPGMWTQKIQDWQNTRTAELPWINCAENDTNGKCTCPVCMSWDIRDPNMTDTQWNNRLANATNDFSSGTYGWENHLGSVTDRYARFYMSVLNQAQAIDPNATVIGYAYANYQLPPISTQLSDHVIIGHVPGTMFPWNDTKSQTFKDSWNGWYSAGARLYLRPNYFLDGHNLPIYFADRFGDDFTYAYERGMISTDFDSLTGQWAAQPLNLYMLGRKTTHGDLPTTEIFNEFYSAFGPAETAVRNYFAYLKSVSDAVTDEQALAVDAHYATFYETGIGFFPPSVLATARTHIAAAQQAATGNAAAEMKVAYLEKGLRHAELQVAAGTAWKNYTSATGGLAAWTAAINALDSFRVSVELDAVANMNYLLTRESRTWQRTIPTMQVQGGTITPLHGDSLTTDQGNFLSKNQYGSEIYLVLDLQSPRTVDRISITNRTDTGTNYNPVGMTVYVAPDESAAGFDPFSKLGYTIQSGSGTLSPNTNTAGTVRSLDITNVNRRYFLLKITSNFWGSVSDLNNSNAQYVYFGNVGVQLVPDATPPTGTISINSGAERTLSGDVTLTLSASDADSGVSSMRFSNNNSVWSDWETFSTTKPWSLSSGYGDKTVYAVFRDGAGLSSSVCSDSITYAAEISDKLEMTGLLVRVWGRVTFRAPDASYFYVDDGSNLDDGSGNLGVRVVCNSGYNQIPSSEVPQKDQFVTVTGVAVRFKGAAMSEWIHAVAPRNGTDIQ